MINVNQITAQLAKMPDQTLQKYAAMHKSDPYILALAVAESTRRKQMRNAAQGAQGMQEQPKVADQAVQGMTPAPVASAQPMPEDMGIGRLPAGDMNFADGGIVAFADGGDVERYNGQYGSLTGDVNRILQKSPYDRTPEENALLQQAGVQLQSRTLGADSGVGRADAFLRDLGPNIRNYFTQGASRLSDEELARQPSAGGFLSERILRGMGVAPSAPTYPQASYSNEGRREPMAAAPSADQGRAAPKAEQKAPPRTDLAPRAPGAAPAAGGFKSLLDQINAPATAAADVNPYAEDFKKQGEARVAAKREYAEGLEAIQKQYADIFKGREERLSKREGELGEMKDKSLGLALLQAGAAMMTTPGNLGMALGKGVDVGSRQYVAGMDKVNAAKERLSDARDRLEELQAQRGELSARELLKAKNEIKTEEAGAQELLIKANMDFYKISREEAMKRLQLQTQVGIAQLETQSRKEIAGMPGAQERLFSTLGGGDVGKGFERYIAATGPEAKGETALVAQFAKDPVALKMLEQTNPQLAALVKQRMSMMLISGAQDTPGAGGARP